MDAASLVFMAGLIVGGSLAAWWNMWRENRAREQEREGKGKDPR